MTNHQATTSGSIYIVATPIGNRDDISIRAIETLKSVDLIIAEDTRHSSNLLKYLAIRKPMTSLHAFNETNKSMKIIDSLQKGTTIALISDAGTPLISDPGFPLVKLAKEKGIQVIPIPGPCAFIAALSAAGVPCEQFTFTGFLPGKQKARQDKLNDLKSIRHTLVFYESTHRIIASLQDIETILGNDISVTVAKELTKSFEHFMDGTPADIIEWLQSDPAHQKGEFVVIIAPREEQKNETKDEKILQVLLTELPLKQAVKITAELTNRKKNELYNKALKLQE